MPGIYDFFQDINNFKENFGTYDEKLKKTYENREYQTPTSSVPPPIDSSLEGSPSYKNQSSSNLVNIDSFSPEISKSGITQTDTGEQKNAFGSINGKGSGFASNAGGIVDFGSDIGKTFSNTSTSESQSWANVGSLTAKGATVGASIGGPWGAAIGGVVGAGLGIVDLIGDSKKRNNKKRDNYNTMLEINKTKREQEQQIKEGKEAIENLTTLRKAQLNYMNIDI